MNQVYKKTLLFIAVLDYKKLGSTSYSGACPLKTILKVDTKIMSQVKHSKFIQRRQISLQTKSLSNTKLKIDNGDKKHLIFQYTTENFNWPKIGFRSNLQMGHAHLKFIGTKSFSFLGQ